MVWLKKIKDPRISSNPFYRDTPVVITRCQRMGLAWSRDEREGGLKSKWLSTSWAPR